MLDTARIVRTPESQFTDNFRKIRSSVAIDLDSGTTAFNTSISLSGQYSTLCRFSYLNRPTDLSVNPAYNQKIWEIGQDVTVHKLNTGKTDLTFPFLTNITAEYSCNNLIDKTEDGYNINIKNWLNHVIPSNYDTIYRFTDFYPDFTGSDSYIYQLVFDREIDLSGSDRNISIANDFVSYSLLIQKQSENIILIKSNLSWKSAVVRKEQISQLIKLFKEVDNGKNLVLRIFPKVSP
jgi:hypothetical protein